MTVEAAERQVVRTNLTAAEVESYDGSSILFHGTPVVLDTEQALADGLVHPIDSSVSIPLYVTESRLGTESGGNPAIGRVKKVRASRQENNRGYFFLVNSVSGMDPVNAVRGALVSPTLVNGKTYSIARSFTVQYFDGDHASFRNSSGDSLNILSYRGAPWSGSNSMTTSGIAGLYIEVEPPSNAITLPDIVDTVTAVNPFAQSAPPVASTTFRSPQEEFIYNAIRALAVVDANGEPVLIPASELKVNTEYLGVRDNETILSTGIFDSARDLESLCDIIAAPEGSHSPYAANVTRSYMGERHFSRFYEARLVTNLIPRRSASYDEAAINRIRSRVEAAGTRWDDMGEALNEMARNRQWCSEYEEAVNPLGWPGRGAQKRAHDITVSVDFTYSSSSVSTDIDMSLRDHTSVDTDIVDSFELTSLEFSGSLQMTFTNIELPWNEGAGELGEYDISDFIDSEMIDRRLPSGYTVDDWSDYETEESDN